MKQGGFLLISLLQSVWGTKFQHTVNASKLSQENDRCQCKDPTKRGSLPLCYPAKSGNDELFMWLPDPTGCHNPGAWPNVNDPKLAECLPRDRKQAIYLVGDSHAYVMQFTIRKATPVPVHHASWPLDRAWNQPVDVMPKALSKVVKRNDIIAMITTDTSSYDDHIKALKAVAQMKGAKLLILANYPWLKQDPSLCFMKAEKSGNKGKATGCGQSYNMVADRPLAQMAERAAQQSPGVVFFFDPLPNLCKPGSFCDVWIPGTDRPAFMDAHHLNTVGREYLAQPMCRFLEEKFGIGWIH